MNSFISDSLNDSRSEQLLKNQEELKQKNKILKEKERIIESLRGQVTDYQNEIEELEKNEQVLKRENSQIKKELNEKIEELEAVSHALKEVETANEALNKRYNARTGQVQKLVDDLTNAKKQVEQLTLENEQLTTQNETLKTELDSKDLALKRQKRDQEGIKSEEALELKNQVKSLKSQLAVVVKSAYRFPTADEVGEFMDPSSVIGNEKRGLEKSSQWNQHNDLSDAQKRPIPTQQKLAGDNKCVNHRIQKSQLIFNDPIAEEKMRLERANELARRNKLTKPLHQTSYALELETFDESVREIDIKRGIVRRAALADQSNQRRPVKKAEFFVV